jgi:hypothetical protein
VFDIGAHAGNRVRAFAALGCRVVAIEPQSDFAWLLRAFQEVQACLTRLIALGPYQFNWTIGESNQLASDR